MLLKLKGNKLRQKASLPIKRPDFMAQVESLGRFSLKNVDVSAFLDVRG